ncbi:MAG: hypothetical protein Q9168_003705, partial [Polycauliona sp. 1 TL-2023]
MSSTSKEHPSREAEQCSMNTRRESSETTFKKPTSFAYLQLVREHPSAQGASDNPLLRTKGELHIREDHTTGLKSIRVESEVHHDDQCLVSISRPSETMTMTTHLATSQPQLINHEPGVTAKVTIWVSRGLRLSAFNIHTDSLDVIFHENVPIPKTTPISITAPSSSVRFTSSTAPPSTHLAIDALQTALTSQFGSVNGDFTLRDSLKIHTLSGSININLSLISSSSTTPAILDLQAQSGSINVNTTTILTPAKIPKRDYKSTLRTNSGAIRATLVHGSSTNLHSDSSSIHASLYPHSISSADDDDRSDLFTNVLSG